MKNGSEFEVKKFSSVEDLLRSYGPGSMFNVMFLDVEMPGLSGIETAKRIREIPDRNVLIFFIFSYPEYMQDSFDVQAYQYLTKSLSYEMFENKLRNLVGFLSDLQTNLAVISQKDGKIILHLEDVISFETVKSLTRKANILVTTAQGEVMIKGKIEDLVRELRDKYFISIHRSMLVNLKYIKRFRANQVELANGKILPASRRKVSAIKENFSKYMVVRYKK